MTTQTFTTCPDCGEIAEIRDRFVLQSTDGQVEHIQLLCIRRHGFVLPTASLERAAAPSVPSTPAHSAAPSEPPCSASPL
ncbi:MAG: hypothetical protein ACRDRV_19035 [Pseudonocardiaceae bacterium]